MSVRLININFYCILMRRPFFVVVSAPVDDIINRPISPPLFRTTNLFFANLWPLILLTSEKISFDFYFLLISRILLTSFGLTNLIFLFWKLTVTIPKCVSINEGFVNCLYEDLSQEHKLTMPLILILKAHHVVQLQGCSRRCLCFRRQFQWRRRR